MRDAVPALLFVGTMLHTASARAQNEQLPPSDFEVPTYVAVEATTADESDEQIELANIVQTAARAITTVQEAPAIVTVIPDEEIHDRGFQRALDIFDGVPGWMGVSVFHGQFDFALARFPAIAMYYRGETGDVVRGGGGPGVCEYSGLARLGMLLGRREDAVDPRPRNGRRTCRDHAHSAADPRTTIAPSMRKVQRRFSRVGTMAQKPRPRPSSKPDR